MTSMRCIAAWTSFSTKSASESPPFWSLTKSLIHGEDRLGRVRHQDPPAEVGVAHYERYRGAVIEVEVGHQHRVDGAEVHLVEVRERSDAGVPGMDAAVEHDAFALVFCQDAGSTNLDPAPRGMISSMSSPSVGAPVSAIERFIPDDTTIGAAAIVVAS